MCGCEPAEPLPHKNPTAATLIFPYNNSLCNPGADINPTTCTMSFDWEAGENTDSYNLVLKNLSTGETVGYPSTNTSMKIVLERGKPYSWLVISESGSVAVTAPSETWKFYVSGDGLTSYAPFPAEIISPLMADTVVTSENVITLDWEGGDIDSDITGYDVYYGTTGTPPLIESDLTESIFINAPISPGTIYFWKIITKDSQGNKSDSGVFQFKVQ